MTSTSRPNGGCFYMKPMSVTLALQQCYPGHTWVTKLGLYYIALCNLGFPFTHCGELQVGLTSCKRTGFEPSVHGMFGLKVKMSEPLHHETSTCSHTWFSHALRHSGILAETLNVTASLKGIQMSHKMKAIWMSQSRPHPITFNLHESRGKRLPFRLAV